MVFVQLLCGKPMTSTYTTEIGSVTVMHTVHSPNLVLPAIREAAAGQKIVYYSGFLPSGVEFKKNQGESWQRELAFLSSEIYALCVAGDIHLVQKRNGVFKYDYIAIKASEEYKKSSMHLRWVEIFTRRRITEYAPASKSDKRLSRLRAASSGEENLAFGSAAL